MAAKSTGRLSDARKGSNLALTPSKAQSRGLLGSGFNIATRLLIWYSIVTILFRCPQSADKLTEASPKVCKPYLQARDIVAPHIEPYYTTYAAPYIDRARPYYDQFDRFVISPSTKFAKTHGAPQVARVQALGQAKWDELVQPQLVKLNDQAKTQYDAKFAPHLQKVSETVSPYYAKSRDVAVNSYNSHLVPAYTTLRPYAEVAYGHGSNFVVNTGIPSVKWAWATTASFFERTLWPRIRILYGENVEPQLVRIGERLGRYRDAKNIQAAVEGVERSISSSSISTELSSLRSSVAAASASSLTSSSSSSTTSTTTSTTSTPSVAPAATEKISTTTSSTSTVQSPASTAPSEAQIRDQAKKVVADDLRTWQEKFAKAADQGADELEERVGEITERLIKSQANGVGEARLIELEETVKSQLKTLRETIISIVTKATPQDIEDAEDKISSAVRKAGFAVREKAQAIRGWRQNYNIELSSLVSAAAEETFKILDHISDLGLQEIGMRWAWTDGVTHKDWAKYHALKGRFDEWRGDVESVVTEHQGLAKATQAAEDVEARAMGIAEDTAKALSELKETARYKLYHGDFSDDLTPHKLPTGTVLENKEPEPEPEPAPEVDVDVEQEAEAEAEAKTADSENTLDQAQDAAAAAFSAQIERVKSFAAAAASSASAGTAAAKGAASDVSSSLSASIPAVSSLASETAEYILSSLASVSASSIPISSDTVWISSATASSSSSASSTTPSESAEEGESILPTGAEAETETAKVEPRSATPASTEAGETSTVVPEHSETLAAEPESTATPESSDAPEATTDVPAHPAAPHAIPSGMPKAACPYMRGMGMPMGH